MHAPPGPGGAGISDAPVAGRGADCRHSPSLHAHFRDPPNSFLKHPKEACKECLRKDSVPTVYCMYVAKIFAYRGPFPPCIAGLS